MLGYVLKYMLNCQGIPVCVMRSPVALFDETKGDCFRISGNMLLNLRPNPGGDRNGKFEEIAGNMAEERL